MAFGVRKHAYVEMSPCQAYNRTLFYSHVQRHILLAVLMLNFKTLKVPIMTAADGKFCNIFPNFRKKSMIFHENSLHERSCLICYF